LKCDDRAPGDDTYASDWNIGDVISFAGTKGECFPYLVYEIVDSVTVRAICLGYGDPYEVVLTEELGPWHTHSDGTDELGRLGLSFD
jgi:hypothetical protein